MTQLILSSLMTRKSRNLQPEYLHIIERHLTSSQPCHDAWSIGWLRMRRKKEMTSLAVASRSWIVASFLCMDEERFVGMRRHHLHGTIATVQCVCQPWQRWCPNGIELCTTGALRPRFCERSTGRCYNWLNIHATAGSDVDVDWFCV